MRSPTRRIGFAIARYCVAAYQLQNGGNEAAPARLALDFAHEKKQPFQLEEVKEGVLVVQGGRILALIDTRMASPLGVKREATGAVVSGELPAHTSARCFVCIPAWKIETKDYASLLENAALMPPIEQYWKALLEPAMQIDIPDPFLADLIRASQVHCMLAARNEERGARVAAWASADRYGPLESESNSIIRGMDMNGQTDFARRSLEFFLNRCSEEGFITTGYTLVGTGEVLWTLGEHYDRTRDRAWLKVLAPKVARICHWIARQREKTKRLDARGQKVPEYGLMPPGVTADWGRYAYRLFNDAQYYAGLESAARNARRRGRSRRAGHSGRSRALSRGHRAGVLLAPGQNARGQVERRRLGAGRSGVHGLFRPRRGFPAGRRRQPNVVLRH